MTMYRLETKNRPRGKFVREGNADACCVRVYQGSIEDIVLQLWSGKRYMMVALFPVEARAIAEQLVAAADKLEIIQ